MEEVQIVNVCKIITMTIKNFDEVMLVVQVRVGKFVVHQGCIIEWWIQCEYHFWKFEEAWIEKAQANSFCSENGWLEEGATRLGR